MRERTIRRFNARGLTTFLVLATIASSAAAAGPRPALASTRSDEVASVSTDLVPSVATSAGAFVSLTPTRIVNTSTGLGAPKAVVASHATVVVQVSGKGGVPVTGADSVALNVTVSKPTACPRGGIRRRRQLAAGCLWSR